MEKVWRSSIAQHRIRLNRGDIGFGQEAIMAWHEQGKGKRPSFLGKAPLWLLFDPTHTTSSAVT